MVLVLVLVLDDDPTDLAYLVWFEEGCWCGEEDGSDGTWMDLSPGGPKPLP